MVDVFVFSDSAKVKKTTESVKSSKNFPVSVFGISALKKIIKKLDSPVLVYLDCSGMDHVLYDNIRFLTKKENVFFGVIDLKKTVYDISDLFFLGAVDYIGAMDLTEEFTEKRFRTILQYINKFRKSSEHGVRKTETEKQKDFTYKIAKTGWDEIKSGKEYTFQIMYIELDGAKDIEKNYTKKNLHEALSTFFGYINRHVSNFAGKMWIWKDLGGIALFPFNGKECRSAYAGFLMYLYKNLHDIEESKFPNFISFRIAIHLGNVVYSKNDTGNVISDTINSVFHIGVKFADPGNCYITGDVHKFLPAKLNSFFTLTGYFEGREIYKMKRPVFTR